MMHGMKYAPQGVLYAVCVLACMACAGGVGAIGGSEGTSKVIVVPSTATHAPSYRGDGSVPSRRYVVRMSDGKRDWEVEFPEVATGYELRIPLGKKRDDGVDVVGDDLTAADKQLLESLRRRNVGMEREGIFENGKNKADPEGKNQLGGLEPGSELDKDGKPKAGEQKGVDPFAGTEDQAAPTRRSYFLGIDKVKKLYRAGKYEVAIVFLKKLERDYPSDLQVLSMMGTLWLKLNQPELAREYWEKVLKIDPTNRSVVEALKQLNARTQGT